MGLPNTILGADFRTGPVPDSTIRRIDEGPLMTESIASSVPLDALAARLEVAVTASAGTQSALSDLLNMAKGLSDAINEVRDTNAELLRELSSIGQALVVHAKERALLEARVEWLSGAMAQGREEAAREQGRLMAEHDGFIAMLMADHDRELDVLRGGPPPLPREPRGELPTRPAIPRLPRRP
jgi:hypothetical protein